MKCEICNKSAADDGVALYRVNELGVKGVWRCTEHLTSEQSKAIDPQVKEITETIQASNAELSHTARKET